jgi:hypothetical protein
MIPILLSTLLLTHAAPVRTEAAADAMQKLRPPTDVTRGGWDVPVLDPLREAANDRRPA